MRIILTFAISFCFFLNFNLFGQKELIGKFGTGGLDCFEYYRYNLYYDNTFVFEGDGNTYGNGNYSVKNDTVLLTYSGELQTQNTIKTIRLDSNEIQLLIVKASSGKPIRWNKLILKKDSIVVDTIDCDKNGIYHIGKVSDFEGSRTIFLKVYKDHFYDPETYERIKAEIALFEVEIFTPASGTRYEARLFPKQNRFIPEGVKEKVIILDSSKLEWKVRYLFSPNQQWRQAVKFIRY